MQSLTFAALLGDGIGPDIVNGTMEVLTKASQQRGIQVNFDVLPAGLSAFTSHGSTLPNETLESLPQYQGWLLGPVSHHVYPIGDKRYINPSGYLRKNYRLYSNVRPVKSFPNTKALKSGIDLVIVRENTEGFYADRNLLDGNGELRPNEDLVISVRVVSRKACLAVARHAFELARQRNQFRKVTAVHKANVLRRGDGLFLECCREVAAEYPDVSLEDYHVDAFAMLLIQRPETFDVVVTTNMFGDILSDEAAGLIGGLGLAPGLNAGDEFAMAQAVHGSAPDIEHLHQANPVAEILSGALLLEWIASKNDIPYAREAAADIRTAIFNVIAEGAAVTPDLGGTVKTDKMVAAIIDALPRA